jgi:hypothetical protein
MFLETDNPEELDEFLENAFNLPRQVSQIIEVRARVVWVNTEKQPLSPSYPIGAGGEFVNLSETSATLIREFGEANAPLQGRIRSGHNIPETSGTHLVPPCGSTHQPGQ